MRNLIAVLFCVTVSAMGWAGSSSFQGLSYSTDGEVVAGKWTSQFAAAKRKAQSENVPLVAIFVRPTCGYSKSLGRALAETSVSNWAAQKGYYLVIGVEGEREASAVVSFVQFGSKLPFVGVWWPRNKSGKEVKVKFNGRSGLMLSTSGSLAQQFMKSVDDSVEGYVSAGGSSGSVPVPLPPVNPARYSIFVTPDPSGGGRIAGTGSFDVGKNITLKATATSGYVFAGWYAGSTLLSQEPTYACAAGVSQAPTVAKFIKKKNDWVVINAFTQRPEYVTKAEITPISVSASGGSKATLSVTKLPSGLKFTAKAIAGHAANTIYGTPTKSGIYSVQVKAKTAGGAAASAIMPLVVRAANERIIAVSCDTSKGKVSGGGVFKDGKKVTVRATALSRQCFTGWSVNGVLVSRSSSYSYPVNGGDVTLVAGFASKEQDLASVSLALDGAAQVAGQVQTRVLRCGVSTRCTVVAKALSGTTVTASGLPSGLKLVKTLVNKDLKEYVYELSGVPTRASAVDSRTKAVKPTVSTFKVSSLGKSSVSYKTAFVVEALPTWAYGNFSGFAAADERGVGAGAATMTVSSSGKISGKFSLFGTSWTYSATGYTSFENSADPSKIRFRFEGIAKHSRQTLPIVIDVLPGAVNCSIADGEGAGLVLTMYRKIWSDRPAVASPKLAKTNLEVFGYGNLALTVSASGSATFAGRLNDGTSASSSSTVFIDADGCLKAYLIVPAKNKFVGYIDVIDISSLK